MPTKPHDPGTNAPVPGMDEAETFRLIAEYVPEIVYRADRDGTITWISASIEALLGRTPAEMVGTRPVDHIHPDDRERVSVARADLVGRGGVRRVEASLVRSDGTPVWVVATSRLVTAADGTPAGFVGTMRDISAEMERRTDLALHTADLAEALAVSRTVAFRVDFTTGLATLSDEALAAFGLPEEWRTVPMERLGMLARTDEDRDGAGAALARMRDGEGAHYEVAFTRPDGSPAWAVVRTRPTLAADGSVTGYDGFATDITETKLAQEALAGSEARYGLLAQHASDVVAHATPEGVCDWVSESVTSALGWEPDEVIGRRFGDLLHPDDLARIGRLGSSADVTRLEGRLRTREGGWRWMAARIERLKDASGTVTGLVSSLRDVQAETEAREALAARTAELEEARRVTGLGLWRRDLRTGTTTWSPEVYSLFGLDPSSPAPEAGELDAMLTPESREARARAAARPGPDGTWRVDLEIVRPDGVGLWVRQSGAVERDAEGVVVGYHGTVRDITDRKRLELALAAREAELREAQRLAHVGSWTIDAATGAMTWSDEMYRILGHEPGGPVPSFAAATDAHEAAARAERDALYARTLETGESWEVEYDLHRPDGSVRRVLGRGEPIRDASDAITGVRGTLADITEAREAGAALEASEAQLAAILDVLPVGLTVLDADHRVVRANAALRRILRLSDEDIETGRYRARRFIRLDGTPMPPEEFASARAIAEQRLVSDVVTGVVLDDGEVIWTRVSAAPGTTPGVSAVVATVDITAQVEARAALAARTAELAEAQRIAHVGSWQTSADGDVEIWSDEMFRIHGLEPGGSVPSAAEQAAFLEPAERARLVSVSTAAFTAGDPFELEYSITRSDGTNRAVVIRGAPMRGTDGSIDGYHGTVIDVTDLREAQARLAEATRLEAIGRLAGGVAHDFNNSLMAILGTAELMADALPPDDPMRDDIAAIEEAGKRASALARQLQAFGRRQTLVPALVYLPGFLQSSAPVLRRAVGPDIDLRIVSTGLVPPVRVDRSQLEQVVLALALNGRAAMAGGGTLTLDVSAVGLSAVDVAAHPGIAPGAYARLTVTDTGDPIAPTDIARVFEPFYSTRQMGRGTGLGLAAVEGIVVQSGGMIDAASGPDAGMTITVLLPAAEAQAATRAEPVPAASVGATGTVLLVEDEDVVRSRVVRMLQGIGYTVLEASGPGEALGLSEDILASVTLVVTDVLMPSMDGGSMAHGLRERRPELPVLFISGFAPDEALLAHLEEPGTAFLAKPFERADLARAARELIGRTAWKGPSGDE